ncbi:unnamed protein product [Blepharisma stoltei]|uniref:TmcB/TmcC TPR repeats domain-containing protein n=1 Tax=Blepharisma stoltei TaxID=1481888 RepID=A0AAU9K646_9CILI|nr:unnamed protein product [Blepharisma stoltei]
MNKVKKNLEDGHHLFLGKSASQKIEKAWKHICSCLLEIYEPRYDRKVPMRTQLLMEILLNSIMTIQSVSMFWYPEIPLRNWESYSTFWEYLSFFNYDSLCEKFGIFNYCFLSHVLVISYSFLIVVTYIILKYLSISIPKFFIFSCRKVISILSSFAMIPTAIIFLVVFKYSTFRNYHKAQEYYENIISDFDYGIPGTIFSSICFCILILLIFANELFTADLKHYRSKRNIKARSNSLWDLYWLMFCIIQWIMFVFTDKAWIVYYWVVLLLISLYLSSRMFRYLHYYNPIENSIQACKISQICCCLVIFIIGYAKDDIMTITLLCIFLPPLVSVFIAVRIHKKYANLKEQKYTYNRYNFEKSIRHLLVEKNPANQGRVLQLFSQCANQRNMLSSGILIVWEANFCICVAKDSRLGRVKLTKLSLSKSSIETTIQKSRILKKLERKNVRVLSEIEYLDYLTKITKVKRYDEDICYTLLDLWSEIGRNNPGIMKLRYFTEEVFYLCSKLRKLYSSLAEKNKYPEVNELYGMFLMNILGEYEEGNLILKRKNHIKEFNSLVESHSKLTDYGENVGAVLISLHPDSFGKISYINEKAAVLLKVSSTDIIGADFSIFIPKPFSFSHNEKMKNCYKFCISTVLEKPHSLVLADHKGYLFKCEILIKLTAFKDKSYFMVSFIQKFTKRQAILISEEGEVYGHTMHLLPLLGLGQGILSGSHISSLFRRIDLKSMFLFEPYIIEENNTEFALVHTTKLIKQTAVHLILVIYDKNEIEIWKSKQADEQLDHYNEASPILSTTVTRSYERFSINFTNHTNSQTTYPDRALTTNYHEKTFDTTDDAKSTTQALSYSQSFLSQATFRFNKRTHASIIRFQWILLFAIVSMIGTNSGILVYIIAEVTHTNSLNIFNHIGQIMFHVGSAADVVRSIDLEISEGKYNLTRDLGLLNQSANGLLSLQIEVLNDTEKWSSCSNTEMFKESVIPIWSFDNVQPELQYYNLYDMITIFVKYMQHLYKNAYTKEGYKEDIKWLIINSLTFPYGYINLLLSSIVDCEKGRVNDTSTTINILLFMGMLILGVCLTALIYFTVCLKIVYEKFWDSLKKSVISAYIALKQTAMDRLSSVHGIELSQDDSMTLKNINSTTFHIQTTLTWKFSWRLSFFGAISLSFYLLIMLYFYKTCQTYMINRPKLLQNFNTRRSLLSRIGLYARDINNPVNKEIYPDSYSFSNSSIELQDLISQYDTEYKQMRSNNLLDLYSDDLKARLFEDLDTSADIMKYGTAAAASAVIFDAYYIGGTGGIKTEKEISDFISNFTALQEAMALSFTKVDQCSKDVISAQLDLIIDITVAFSVGLLLLYFCYYLPFLKKQINFLTKTKILPKMIPILITEKRFEDFPKKSNLSKPGLY